MQRKTLSLLAAGFAAIMFSPAFAEPIKTIKTERGADVEVIEDIPSGPGPFPAVILAPGGQYHARLPILDQLSKSLTANGIAVLRFNWAYYTKDGSNGRASRDQSAEMLDMKAVLERAKANPQIDKARIALAGKSNGSIVTWKMLRLVPEARGALLLTPVCSRVSKDDPTPKPEENYKESAPEKRPVLMISGVDDPYCSTPILYRYVAALTTPVRLAIISGNHSLEIGDRADSAMTQPNAANVDLAARIATDFIKTLFR